jgi:2-methylcitrate dehydratase PrpD
MEDFVKELAQRVIRLEDKVFGRQQTAKKPIGEDIIEMRDTHRQKETHQQKETHRLNQKKEKHRPKHQTYSNNLDGVPVHLWRFYESGMTRRDFEEKLRRIEMEQDDDGY